MNKVDEFKISNKNVARIFDDDFVAEIESKGTGCMQEALGVSEGMLEKYYSVAAKLLEKHDWAKAADAFLFLTFLNPSVHNFWLGLGVAYQSVMEFDRALSAYFICGALDSTHPTAFANACQCELALGRIESAETCRLKALECCGVNEEWHDLKEQLSKMQSKFSSV